MTADTDGHRFTTLGSFIKRNVKSRLKLARRIFWPCANEYDGSRNGSLALVQNGGRPLCVSVLNLALADWFWATWLVDFSACASDSDQPVHTWSQATESEEKANVLILAIPSSFELMIAIPSPFFIHTGTEGYLHFRFRLCFRIRRQ